MALKMSVHSKKFDITFPDAYVKIDSAQYTPQSVIVSVRVWPTEAARGTGRATVGDYTFVFPREDATAAPVKPLANAYALLKTMDQFTTAVDA